MSLMFSSFCVTLTIFGCLLGTGSSEPTSVEPIRSINRGTSIFNQSEIKSLFESLDGLLSNELVAVRIKGGINKFKELFNENQLSCEDATFNRLSNVIKSIQKTHSLERAMENLIMFEKQLLAQCKPWLDSELKEAVASLDNEDLQSVSQLVATIKLPARMTNVAQPSSVAMATSRTTIARSVPQFLRTQAGSLFSAMSFDLRARSRERREFNEKYDSYLIKLCARISSQIKPAVRVYDYLSFEFNQLDEFTSKWVKAAKVCRAVDFLGEIGKNQAYAAFRAQQLSSRK